MKYENGKISGKQFMFTVACFIQSSALLASFFTPLTKQDSWLIIVVALFIDVPLVLVFSSIMNLYPGKSLIRINEEVFGKFVGKVISVIYMLFFFTLLSLNTRDLGMLVVKTMLPNTPLVLILLLFIMLCVWAAGRGAETVTRYGALFAILSFSLVLFATALTLDLIKTEHFQPMFESPLIKYVQAVHIVSVIPLSEVFLFMMFNPNIETEPKKLPKFFVGGILIGIVNMFLVVARDTGVLGNTIQMFTIPSFETLGLINLNPAFSRMDVLFAFIFMILLFFKIGILLYVTLQAFMEIFHLKSPRKLAFGIGLTALIYSLTMFSSSSEHSDASMKTLPFAWLFLESLLPLLTFIVAKIKQSKKMKKHAPDKTSAPRPAQQKEAGAI